MNIVTVVLPRQLNSVELHNFSDWHIGDKFCDIAKIKADITHVKETPSAYVILNGDLLNNATKTSVSDCYAELLTPMQQIETIVTLLEPIKDKILFATTGNHEARTYRTDGIDLTAVAMKELGILDRYCKEGGLLFLKVGENQASQLKGPANAKQRAQVLYSIYATHGSGGGRKEGAKAIRLADMASIVDADIYIHSHTHLPMVLKEAMYRTDMSNCTVKKVDKLFINTAASLNYGGYGQTYEFKPASKANPVIYLSGTHKSFTARL